MASYGRFIPACRGTKESRNGYRQPGGVGRQQDAPEAVTLLRLLSCYAMDPVPLRRLLHPQESVEDQLGPEMASVLAPLLGDPIAIGDALAALHRYSLVSAAQDGSLSAHRLVQAVTLDQMPVYLAGQWRYAAAVVIEAALPGDPEQPETWATYSALLPHAMVALSLKAVAWPKSQRSSEGLAAALLPIAERALVPTPWKPWPSGQALPGGQGGASDAAGARDQYAAVLPFVERTLGSEHVVASDARIPHLMRAAEVTAGECGWAGPVMPSRG